MGWFWNRRKKNGAWDLASVEPPWESGTAIYAHIKAHVAPGARGLTEGGERLPDEKDDGGIKWVAGGLDGAFGHHGGGGSEKTRAKTLFRNLEVVLEDAAPTRLKKLYQQLRDESVLDFVDPLMERIVQEQSLDASRLEELALWIAKNAPDREPVKFALALLGLFPDSDHSELLLALGRHEEFTLYAAVALTNTKGEAAEEALFELAENVDGWGRIQVVERLADTRDERIKAWLLREGYKNSVMYEYLAYTCASSGNLRKALEAEAVDPELLAGAGDIIQALIAGGPAEDMDDYADGAIVVDRYLHHLGAEPRQIEQLIAVDCIEQFLKQETEWNAREERGWTPELRNALISKVETVKRLPYWPEVIAAELASTDPIKFSLADQAARAIGIDTWQHHFDRLKAGSGDSWYAVMQTDNPKRIDEVLQLAESTIPLDKIATGPAEEMGLGLEWADHSHLDFVLQDLRRFPGKGWPLIRTGARSPVVRNRHMALRALSSWGKDRWPTEARALLQSALQEEPDEDVRSEIETLLAGKQLED